MVGANLVGKRRHSLCPSRQQNLGCSVSRRLGLCGGLLCGRPKHDVQQKQPESSESNCLVQAEPPVCESLLVGAGRSLSTGSCTQFRPGSGMRMRAMMPDRPREVTISMSRVTGLRLAKDPPHPDGIRRAALQDAASIVRNVFVISRSPDRHRPRSLKSGFCTSGYKQLG